MNKGKNMQSVKNENRSLVLYLLNSCGNLSRKEIAKRLELTPAAVTKICNELIERGLIRECGESKSAGKSGRKEILLSLCLKNRLCFGISAEQDAITFSVCGYDGTLLQKQDIPFTDNTDEVIAAAKRFLMEQTIDIAQLTCCGICIIGSLEEADFGVWKEPDLRHKFALALGMPVLIENNVKAFAEAELLYGGGRLPGASLLLKWGPGVGSSIISNGKVFSGSDSAVTEIGHYIVHPGGKKCRCGRYGCLETEVNEEAMMEAVCADNKFSLDEKLKNCDNNTINSILHKIDAIALALTNTATILRTQRVILYGRAFHYPLIADNLRKQYLRYNPSLSEDSLAVSSLNDKRTYIGSAAICAKHMFFERAM